MRKLIKVLLLFISVVAYSQQMPEKSKKRNSVLEVNGNCEMCKARIEKACLKTKGVKYAYWDVASKKLSVVYNENKTELSDIQQSVLMVGHDVDSLRAAAPVYNSLHACCKFRE